jgi:hypothetical protein
VTGGHCHRETKPGSEATQSTRCKHPWKVSNLPRSTSTFRDANLPCSLDTSPAVHYSPCTCISVVPMNHVQLDWPLPAVLQPLECGVDVGNGAVSKLTHVGPQVLLPAGRTKSGGVVNVGFKLQKIEGQNNGKHWATGPPSCRQVSRVQRRQHTMPALPCPRYPQMLQPVVMRAVMRRHVMSNDDPVLRCTCHS